MKGLLNNDQAVNVLNNLKGSLDNRIHEIYNLGYQKGYKDGKQKAIEVVIKWAEGGIYEFNTERN